MGVANGRNGGLPDVPTDGEAHDVVTGNPRNRTQRRDITMQVIALHDVDDVEHWFNSPARSEFFEARGMTATAFRDPAGNANTVAVLIEAPDLDSLQAALATPEAKVTEEHDGVHVDTLKLFLDA